MRLALYQAACVAVPKGLGGVLAVVLNGLLLVRMTPVEFGVYMICVTLVTLGDAVLGSAIDMSSIKLASAYRLHDMRRAVAVEQWAAVLKIALTTAVLAAVLPLASTISPALFHRDDPALLTLVLAVAAGVLLMRSISAHLQLRQRFGAYAGLELLAQAMRAMGIGAVLLWFEPTAMTLTWAAAGGTVVALVAGVRIARLHWQPLDLRWAEGADFVRHLRWMLATFAFSSLLARMDLLLLTPWSTMEQVGIFAAAQVFASIPEMLGMWLAVVFSPRVAPARLNGTLRHLMNRVQLALAGIAALVILATWVVVQWGTQWLPPGYAGSTDVLMPLVLGALAGMLALPVTVPFLMFTKPGFILTYDLVTLPILLLAYYWAIGHSGAVGAAWVSGGSRIIKAAVLQGSAWMWMRPGNVPITSPS